MSLGKDLLGGECDSWRLQSVPGHWELWEGLLALGELQHFGTEKIIRAKSLLGLSQRHAGCLCSVKKNTESKTLLTRKGPARWLEAGRVHWPCPQLSHCSRGTCGCFPFAACTSPSDAAWCSKAPACVRRPQLPQSSAVGRHQPAQSQHNQPSLPDAQRVPLPSPALGT